MGIIHSFLIKGDELYDVTGMILFYKDYCVLTKHHHMLNAEVFCKKVVGWVSEQEKHICNDSELYNFVKENINEYIFLNGFSRAEVQKISELVVTENNKLRSMANSDVVNNKCRKKTSTKSKSRKK